jgi:site-specific DNA-methyltransferase (adenine-specific)
MNCIAGDATTFHPYREALGDRRADLLFTDPPYCLLTRRRKNGAERDPKGIKNEGPNVRRFEDVRSYRDFTRAWLGHAVQHLSTTAPLIVWTNLLGRSPIREVAHELGFSAQWGEYVWGKKTREANSGEELLRVVETALVLGRQPLPVLRTDEPARPWAAIAGYDDDGEAQRFGNHPNHKPFGVLEPLVRSFSRPGQLILDCFAGSGSLPAAALRLGRLVACIEIDATWAERVTHRLMEHT